MNTLFKKLLFTYISIIIISFLILTYGMSYTFKSYFMNEKEKTLIKQAESIQNQYLLASKTGIINYDKLNFEIQAWYKYQNTHVWLINRKGDIYINSAIQDISLIKEELKYNEIEKVFSGETIKREGYFKKLFSEQVLTVGYPIKINDQVVFALFMHASIPEINKTISDTYKIAFFSILFSTGIALILVFVLSRNLTSEIKNINDIAKKISKGNFNKRLTLNRKDELGELALSFNEMAYELNKLEEMRRKFISDISHDLRTPLTTINGFVKAILDGTIEEEKQKKYLEIVSEESERLTKLTNDILDLSRIQSGEISLEKSKFNINELLINEIDKFEEKILNKNINIEIKLTNENSVVNGDIGQITRVIYNLLDNGIKFCNENGLIKIETLVKNQKIHVSIMNTGSKINKEDISRIWDRFHKLDISRGKDKTGSGLGLSIVKEIIKSHNEEIEVYSHEKGVEFVFTMSLVHKTIF